MTPLVEVMAKRVCMLWGSKLPEIVLDHGPAYEESLRELGIGSIPPHVQHPKLIGVWGNAGWLDLRISEGNGIYPFHVMG